MSKVWLKDVTFNWEADEDAPLGPHLAYTTPSQGGAASGLNEALVLKSTTDATRKEALELLKSANEVRVVMSFEKFLQKFFHLYESDAAALSLILGYESEKADQALEEFEKYDDAYYLKQIASKMDGIELLKSLDNNNKKFNDLELEDQVAALGMQLQFEKGLSDITVTMTMEEFLNSFGDLAQEEQQDALIRFEQRADGIVAVKNDPFIMQRVMSPDFMKSLGKEENFNKLSKEDKVNLKLFQVEFEKSLLSKGSPEDCIKGDNNPDNKTDPIIGDQTMTEKDSVKLEDLEKSLDEMKKNFETVQKANEALVAEKEGRIEKDLIAKAAEFSFVDEDSASPVGKLFKSLSEDDLAVLLNVLKAAQEAATKVEAEENVEDENSDMFVQKGADGEGVALTNDEARIASVNKALGLDK